MEIVHPRTRAQFNGTSPIDCILLSKDTVEVLITKKEETLLVEDKMEKVHVHENLRNVRKHQGIDPLSSRLTKTRGLMKI